MKRSAIIFLSFALVFSTLLCAGCNKKNQSENNQNQESINEMSGTDLTFTGALQKHTAEFGTILYYKVSNNKIVFSFSDYIKINKTSTWSVSLDLYGRVNIPSKTADLAEGDNIFYILVTDAQEKTKQYIILIEREIVIKRAVTFYVDGQIFYTTQVNDGEKLTYPTSTPTKNGFKFVKWDYDFNKAVKCDLDINSLWEVESCKVHLYFRFIFENDFESYFQKELTVKKDTVIEDVLKKSELQSIFTQKAISTIKDAEDYWLLCLREMMEYNVENVTFSHYMIREYPYSSSGYIINPSIEKRAVGTDKLTNSFNELYYVFVVKSSETFDCKVKIDFQYNFAEYYTYSETKSEFTVEKQTKILNLLQMSNLSVNSVLEAENLVLHLLKSDAEICNDYNITSVTFRGYQIRQTAHGFSNNESLNEDTDEHYSLSASFNEVIYVFDIEPNILEKQKKTPMEIMMTGNKKE